MDENGHTVASRLRQMAVKAIEEKRLDDAEALMEGALAVEICLGESLGPDRWYEAPKGGA